MAASAQSSMATIENFLARVGGGSGHTKTADGGSDGGKAHTEPGSIGGETSHPVKNVNDRTRTATEGARSAENTRDVKEDQGAPSVENAAEATPKTAAAVAASFAKNPFTQKVADEVSSAGSAAEDAEESELDPQPTGKGEHLTSSAKSGKKDPGSTHPARTDNTAIDGHKWANDDPVKIAADLAELGNQLCAQIGWLAQGLGDEKTAAAAVAQQSNGRAGQVKQAQLDPHLQAQIGWEMAGLLSGQMDKRAADAMVQEALEQVIETASNDAIKVAHYLDNFFASAQQAQKQAAGEEMPPGMAGGGGAPPMDPAQMAGGGPPGPDGMGAGGGGGGGPPPGLAGAMGGGESGAGGGGEDMMAALGGGHPADAGGDGGGGEGGAGGGGEGHEQEAALLAKLCEQLGVTPEELIAQMHAEGGGAGGGGGEEMGGGGGGEEIGEGGGGGGGGAAAGGIEHQGSDQRRGPNNRRQATQTSKRSYDENSMRDYITEVISRSRRSRG